MHILSLSLLQNVLLFLWLKGNDFLLSLSFISTRLRRSLKSFCFCFCFHLHLKKKSQTNCLHAFASLIDLLKASNLYFLHAIVRSSDIKKNLVIIVYISIVFFSTANAEVLSKLISVTLAQVCILEKKKKKQTFFWVSS